MSFKRLDPEDISISADSIVAPLWSTDAIELSTFFTSSAQVASNSGNYYYTVYDQDIDTAQYAATARSQMAIGFGDKTGRGETLYNVNVPNLSPSSTIYGQYRNLVFGDEDTDFLFGTVTSDYFYFINIDRSRYKEKLFPGTFELKLTSGSKTLHLTDNSNDTSTVSYTDAGRVYEIISGSAGSAYNSGSGGNGYSPAKGSYGKFLPDVGIILLNGYAINTGDGSLNLNTTLTPNTEGNNPAKLYNAINSGASFDLQSEETISSNYIFVRVRNSEFNYSTNPSNITGSGELTHDVMINSPQAYITTVGLYNDDNELLGVAKLSRPLLKDFTKEALVRIKLDY
jgi:hypothetical protein